MKDSNDVQLIGRFLVVPANSKLVAQWKAIQKIRPDLSVAEIVNDSIRLFYEDKVKKGHIRKDREGPQDLVPTS